MLAPYPNPKLEDYAFSAVRDRFFNLFLTTFHIEGLSSNRNLRSWLAENRLAFQEGLCSME
jgi:hypothetical protein